MARSKVILTENYQLISSKTAVITVLNIPPDETPLYLNSVNSDDSVATIDRPKSSDQYLQNAIATLYAKGVGYTLLVDEEG